MRTVAPGMAAPDESRTRPSTAPGPACAKAAAGDNTTISVAKTYDSVRIIRTPETAVNGVRCATAGPNRISRKCTASRRVGWWIAELSLPVGRFFAGVAAGSGPLVDRIN